MTGSLSMENRVYGAEVDFSCYFSMDTILHWLVWLALGFVDVYSYLDIIFLF